MFDVLSNEEKKVEYIELVYDLIFVYIIGRNNSLVSEFTGGFIEPEAYLTYVVCTLITIQVWYITTLFINRYGSNSHTDHLCLFINMFLLYYMADGISVHWEHSFYRFNIAWMLINANMGIQYYIKYRQIVSKELSPSLTISPSDPLTESLQELKEESSNILYFVKMQVVMVLLIAAGIMIYRLTGIPLTPLALVGSIIMVISGRKNLDYAALDFAHLAERIMLYIVFTFGEMIIAISGYFSGGFTILSFYYALCAFLIVVGLFTSYGFFYDHLLDTELKVSGNIYMILHVVIIMALSNLTMALEFMREHEIAEVPKNLYLIASFAVFYIFLFSLAPFTKGFKGTVLSFRDFWLSLALFVLAMIGCIESPEVGIAISVLMTFWIWYLEYRHWKKDISGNQN